MAWIESHQALKEHPKTKRLARAMQWTIPETIGRLHMFWWWCVDYSLDGDLRKFNDADIAEAVGLDASRGQEFVSAMIDCGSETGSGFVERNPYFRVHDWWEYAGNYIRTKYSHTPDKWQKIKALYDDKTKHVPSTRKARAKQTTPTDLTYLPTIPTEPTTTAMPPTSEKETAKRKVFTAPTPQQVVEYAASIGYTINGQEFCDYYVSKGWLVGKSPMKDWKASVRLWKSKQPKGGSGGSKYDWR